MYPLVFLKALLISAAMCPVLIAIAKRQGWMDLPSPRKVHVMPMPRIGGMAIFTGFAFAVLPLFVGSGHPLAQIFTMGAFIFFIGLLDDLLGLPALVKLGAQIIASAALWRAGVQISSIAGIHLGWVSFPVTVLWVLCLTNGFNLIDGLDGLSAGVGIIACAAFLFIGMDGHVAAPFLLGGVALCGALVGFLPLNFHPAKLFMGDSGSTFLGFVMAALFTGDFFAEKGVGPLIPLLILGLPLLDVSYAFLRRVAARRSPFQPDRMHIHHNLMRRGFSHRRAVYLLYAMSLVLAAIAALAARFLK